jgi:hypothetical protein
LFKFESFCNKQSSSHQRKFFLFNIEDIDLRYVKHIDLRYVKHIDLRYVKQMVIFSLQFILFCFLFIVGFIYGLLYTADYCVPHACYFSTHARLAKLQTTSIDGCSDLTDPDCFRQRSIYNFFFRVRLLIIYYSSIIIAMVYMWHRTVRLSWCFFVLLVVTVIVFCTDLIIYYDQVVYISSTICFFLVLHYPLLMAYLSENVDDPFSVICGHNISPNDLHEFLLNDTSKRARFYRWTNKMKKK